MKPSPPLAPSRPPRSASTGPRLALEGQLVEGERDLCFAVEGSPPGSGRSLPAPDGRIRLVHELEGTVVSVSPSHLDLGSAVGLVKVRLVLPSGLRLAPLLGHWVRLYAVHVVGERTCFDLRLRDVQGELVLWAFDGRLPSGDEELRVVFDAAGDELVFFEAQRPPARASHANGLELEGKARRLVRLRASASDAAFVVV